MDIWERTQEFFQTQKIMSVLLMSSEIKMATINRGINQKPRRDPMSGKLVSNFQTCSSDVSSKISLSGRSLKLKLTRLPWLFLLVAPMVV